MSLLIPHLVLDSIINIGWNAYRTVAVLVRADAGSITHDVGYVGLLVNAVEEMAHWT